jgi:tryptophan synthase alpha chain
MKNNRINRAFEDKKHKVLNIYFTAGYPNLNDTGTIIKKLASAKVDIIELGIPYSDPLADGLTIQESSQKALSNGISLSMIFDQVQAIKNDHKTAIVMMGYFNQFLQYGIDKLIKKIGETGVDGLIIPDLPMDHYKTNYKSKFEEAGIALSFLITPETSDERIKEADKLTSGFLYVVAQSSITGGVKDVSDHQKKYFDRIKSMSLTSPKLIGFGIHNKKTFDNACQYAEGAIIGSAFIRNLKEHGTDGINDFVNKIVSR